MLEHLLTSKTRIKILTLLMFNQDKEFHLREIARIISISPIYVTKELDNLIKINLVKKTKKANLNIYSINKECIFLNELKTIFLKTDFLGELIKKELENKVKYCFIYGSFAKGIEKAKSDIDLFLVSEMKEDELIKIIQKLENKIKREINYVLWNEKTFNQRAAQGHHLLRTIKKDKIIMLLGSESEFRKQIK